jgi:extracellular elastinolytic metalloproteinase
MKRELDTRKESESLFGKPLSPRGAGVAAFAARQPAAVASPEAPRKTLIDKALAFVQRQPGAFGFTADEVAEFVPDPTVQRTSSGASAVHLQQYYRGVPVFEMARTVRFSPQSEAIDASGNNTAFPTAIETEPKISAVDALRRVVTYLAATGGEVEKDEFGQESEIPRLRAEDYKPEILTSFNLPSRPTVLAKGPFEKPVPAHLVLFIHPARPRLAWHIVPTFPNYEDQYVILVSADDPVGEILYSVSTLHRMLARGSVFELSPGLKQRASVAFPRPIAEYPDMPTTPLVGFPADWVKDGKTIGNAARATLGFGTNTLAGHVQDGVTTFEPQDESGDDQKLLNIFYFCNYMHDFLFLLGFDEAAGNFQESNFTHTGLGNDPVQARAHSGPVRGTANMATFPDGQPPVMNMGLVASTRRHTAFDADVVCHEYTHGLTNRLVGGPMNTNALNAPQSSGMGEGWSDYYALTIVSYLIGREKVVTGDWVVQGPQGIRTAPYDDNYPSTFGDISQMTDEHDIGEVWCAALMMFTRRVRQALGNDQDGYRLCWQIVTDGLKLTPANPSFLDARDAILLALDHLKDTGKLSSPNHRKVRKALWEAFARFGMGVRASSNGPELDGIVADTSLPTDL